MSAAFIFGTRPEITKSAGIARALAQQYGIRVFGLCTGQQTTLVRETISDLDVDKVIPLNWSSDEQRTGQDPDWLDKSVCRLPQLLRNLGVTAVVGTGDTNSVLVGARAAQNQRLPFVHLEAGIRHLVAVEQPEPEEINRRKITRLATFNLCPTARQRTNLLAEGVGGAAVQVIGDLSCAAVSEVWRVRRGRIADGRDRGDSKLSNILGRVCVCTFHRSTSLLNLDNLVWAFNELVRCFPHVSFFLCKRPDTRWERFYSLVQGASNVYPVASLRPSAFQELLSASDIVLTDSAGVQQEAILLSRAVIALRDNVELYFEDPLLSIVRPPFHGLLRVFSQVLSHRSNTHELGLSNVTRSGSLVIDRGARMISEFYKVASSDNLALAVQEASRERK